MIHQDVVSIMAVEGFQLLEEQEIFWPEYYLVWATSQIVTTVAGKPKPLRIIGFKANTIASRW